jgi:hypothetical protein
MLSRFEVITKPLSTMLAIGSVPRRYLHSACSDLNCSQAVNTDGFLEISLFVDRITLKLILIIHFAKWPFLAR